MRNLLAAALVSALALGGVAQEARASATVDLIWIDVSNVDTAGEPICLQPLERNCPQLGTTLSAVSVNDRITLGVIVTAGPGGVVGAGVSVDYSNLLPIFSVDGFRRLNTSTPGRRWLLQGVGNTSDIPPFIDNINATSLVWYGAGIGLPSGQTAYLGTVSFRKDQPGSGSFEIAVGVDGPRRTDAVGNLAYEKISSTTTFNSAFVSNVLPTPTPTASPAPDSDEDGVPDAIDNCSEVWNPSQDDTDGDFCGNLCDADYDQSGWSGFADFFLHAMAFGSGNQLYCNTEPVPGCTVGFDDFFFLSNVFGKHPGPSGTTPGTVACP